jgi:hypothetical protein
MPTHEFPVIICFCADTPPVIPGVVFVAPRPLFGRRVDVPGLNNWAGLVALADDYDGNLAAAVEQNLRLDARVVTFVAAAEAKEVGRETACTEYDRDDVLHAGEDAWLDYYRWNVAPKKVLVTVEGDTLTVGPAADAAR